MATVQGGPGLIRLFHDFGSGKPVADTLVTGNLGDFFAGGEGIADGTAGIIPQRSDGLSGVGQFVTGDTQHDTTAVMTGFMFDVALMGPIVLEVRLRFDDFDDKAAFVGFANSADDDIQLTDILDYSSAEVVTLTATNILGFWLSSELTDDEDWHAVHQGGTATAVTDTTAIDLNDEPAAGLFQILRLEIDPDGTARWLIDGVVQKTLEGAVSTTTDLAMVVAVANNNGSGSKIEVDYILVTANRDWTI